MHSSISALVFIVQPGLSSAPSALKGNHHPLGTAVDRVGPSKSETPQRKGTWATRSSHIVQVAGLPVANFGEDLLLRS